MVTRALIATRETGIARNPRLQRTHQRQCRPESTSVCLSRPGDALSVPVSVLACANLHGVSARGAHTGGSVVGSPPTAWHSWIGTSATVQPAMKSVDGFPSTRACTPAEYPSAIRQDLTCLCERPPCVVVSGRGRKVKVDLVGSPASPAGSSGRRLRGPAGTGGTRRSSASCTPTPDRPNG